MTDDLTMKPTKRACDFCRRRKIKCTGKRNCPSCVRLNNGNCTFDVPVMKRGPKGSRGSTTPENTIGSKPNFITKITPEINMMTTATTEINMIIPTEYNMITTPEYNMTNTTEFSMGSQMNSNLICQATENLYLTNSPESMNYNPSEVISTFVSTPPHSKVSFSKASLEFNSNYSFSGSSTSIPVTYTIPYNENVISHQPESFQTNNFHQPNDFQQPKSHQLNDFHQPESYQANSFHQPLKVPEINQLQYLEYWPISNDVVDRSKLILFLENLPNDKISTKQISAIMYYLTNFHSHLQMLDLNTFLYQLAFPFTSSLSILLDNIEVLHKLGEADLVQTNHILCETWLASRQAYCGFNVNDPFQIVIYALDFTISRLTHLLV